jgi:hypothetical protein
MTEQRKLTTWRCRAEDCFRRTLYWDKATTEGVRLTKAMELTESAVRRRALIHRHLSAIDHGGFCLYRCREVVPSRRPVPAFVITAEKARLRKTSPLFESRCPLHRKHESQRPFERLRTFDRKNPIRNRSRQSVSRPHGRRRFRGVVANGLTQRNA